MREHWIIRLCMVLLLLVQGCSTFGTLSLRTTNIVGFSEEDNVSPEDLMYRGEYNWQRLKFYDHERPYRNGDIFPQRCLALSGGGIRSASYALGALRALSNDEQLDNLDIISTVSGGGYASAWYYSHMYGYPSERSSAFLFASKHAKLPFAPHGNGYLTDFYYAVTMPAILANGLLYPLMDLPQNDNPPGLLRAYATVYRRRLVQRYFFHDTTKREGEQPLTLAKLGSFIRDHQLPLPIFNMTIQGRDTNKLSAHGQIFEATPYHAGSDYFGYWIGEIRSSIEETVALSGAAPDVPPTSGTLRAIRVYLGLILGKTIWANAKELRDKRNYYFLSDGGHSENLGAFPLIRRRCSEITIIDGEEDPDYNFEGYIVLKSLVANKLNATLAVHDIDSYLKTQIHSTLPRGVNPSWVKPVMFGEVQALPVRINGLLLNDPIRVTYLKLSFDRCAIPHAHTSTCLEKETITNDGNTYYTDELKELVDGDESFPMYSTLNQWLGSRQMEALAALGHAHMKLALRCKKVSPCPTMDFKN